MEAQHTPYVALEVDNEGGAPEPGSWEAMQAETANGTPASSERPPLSMRKKILIGTCAAFAVALIVGLSVGLTEDKSHQSSTPQVVCGGIVSGSTKQKLSCYPTTPSSGIKVNTQAANLQTANSFCQSKLASDLSVSASDIVINERIIVPGTMASACSEYASIGSTVPPKTRVLILNVSGLTYTGSVATGFGQLLAADTSAAVLDSLSTSLLQWFKSSSKSSQRDKSIATNLDSTISASLHKTMSTLQNEMKSKKNDLMPSTLCNTTFGFTGDSLTFCQAALGKNSFTKYLIGLQASQCNSCTALIYSSTMCGALLKKNNLSSVSSMTLAGGSYTNAQLYTGCKLFIKEVISGIRKSAKAAKRRLTDDDDSTTPAPSTPSTPATPAPSTAADDDATPTPAPATPAPGTSATPTPAPATPAPGTSATPTPAPATPAPGTPATPTPSAAADDDDNDSTGDDDDDNSSSGSSSSGSSSDDDTNGDDYYSSSSGGGDDDGGDGSSSSSEGDDDGSSAGFGGDDDGSSGDGSSSGDDDSSKPLGGVSGVVDNAIGTACGDLPGLVGTACSFATNAAEGDNIYNNLGSLAVGAAEGAIGAACPPCGVGITVMNWVDPSIGNDLSDAAGNVCKDVIGGISNLL